MKAKPENVFIKKVKVLLKTINDISNQEGYYPFGTSYEAAEKDCIKRPDGLWELKGKDHNGCKVVFLWRLGSKYCILGQPIYDADKRIEYFNNSETEKVIHTHNGIEYVMAWYEWLLPTKNVWGLRQGPVYLVMRRKKNKRVLVRTELTYAAYQRAVKDYWIGKGNEKIRRRNYRRYYSAGARERIRTEAVKAYNQAAGEEQIRDILRLPDGNVYKEEINAVMIKLWSTSSEYNLGVHDRLRDKDKCPYDKHIEYSSYIMWHAGWSSCNMAIDLHGIDVVTKTF